MNYQNFPTLALYLLLAAMQSGCMEGGTGGTGGFEPPDTTTISGYDHKGPYQAGATVTVTQLSEAGERGVLRGSAQVLSDLGDYELTVEVDGPIIIDVSGTYFSEILGQFTTGDMLLSAIIDPATGSARANVNLLTALIHGRVIQLLGDSDVETTEAIELAQSELTLALSSLIAPPSDPVVFSNLLIINSIQDGDNEEGNAYLLAVTSLLEQYAVNLALQNGSDQLLELTGFVEHLTDDLADDGALDLTNGLQEELQEAIADIDPRQIFLNLLKIDEVLDLAVQASDGVDIGAITDMTTALDEVVTVADASFEISINPDSNDPLRATIPVESIVADMNLFLDSDQDGISNRDDEDDDGDGIDDTDDDTPYGEGQ